jgi:phosphate starvation-inducible PhoH-like protein
MRHTILFTAILLSVLLVGCSGGKLKVTSLKVEMQENPVGLNTLAPRFSWQISSTTPDLVQQSYQIQVALTEEELKKGINLLWDSGVVDSDLSVLIPYRGESLVSRGKYYWRVKVNSNVQLLKTLFPKLRIVARGNVIKVIGDENELNTFEEKVHELEKFSIEMNLLKEEDILDIVKGKAPTVVNQDNLIIHGLNGKPILARTANQKKLVDAFGTNDLVFAIGPAGSGKTYTAIALAVRALKTKQVRKIILSRPAVEAGEKLGFLPGDMKEKIDPYLQPLYDALEDMIPPLKLKEYIENKIIQIAPLAFMRGRTLNDAIIILDEAQNTTKQQIKMFLTRLGLNGKMIVTGDVTQIDLPTSQQSGLTHSMNLLKGIKGISTVEFNKKDIVRHKLVQRIVEAYEKEVPEHQYGNEKKR